MCLLWAMIDFRLQRVCGIAQAVSCQPVAVEGQVWFWASSWKFYDGQSDWYGIFSERFGFLVSVISPVIHTHPHLHATFTERTITQGPGTIRGVIFLTKARNVVQESDSSFFFPLAFEEIIAMFSFLNCLTFRFGISETNYSIEFIKVLLSSSIYINKLHDKESFASPIEYNTYFSLIHREIRWRLHRLRSFLAKSVRII